MRLFDLLKRRNEIDDFADGRKKRAIVAGKLKLNKNGFRNRQPFSLSYYSQQQLFPLTFGLNPERHLTPSQTETHTGPSSLAMQTVPV